MKTAMKLLSINIPEKGDRMKQYDFDIKPGMTGTAGLLHSMVRYNFERLKRQVKGLTQEEIDYKGKERNQNSIAELLRHLSVVDLNWVYRLQCKEVPKEWIEKLGPMIDENGKLPAVHRISVSTLIQEYEGIQDMFENVCMNIKENQLEDQVPFENGNTASIRWGIWHVADHSRHHYAQIVSIKKQFLRD
ncbi:DinB family protein [Paenibacillus urinalis]|uniref:DinB family protein n=2 Tax=Paenibacillus urinalis TaxID=521520 RepID=A0ABY7XD25_9BACL|nr:DinB family protein [Paenibacillus urinalis]WDH95500.1 DinB family protein [Paenibacillus urinalis]WDI03698.1 DinB family protein [Paenibacillus urinalis]